MAIDKALLNALSDGERESVRQLVDKGVKLPPQPAVLDEMNHLLTRGVSDLRVIGRTISQDGHGRRAVQGHPQPGLPQPAAAGVGRSRVAGAGDQPGL